VGRVLRTSAVLVGLALMAPASAAAELELDPIDSHDYDSPVYVTSEPGDPDRLYVVEQDGRIRLSTGGVSSPFLDISDRVISPEDGAMRNEQGLFSIAFDPEYDASGLFYVYYTTIDDPGTSATDEEGDLRTTEFDADTGGSVEDTERAVLEIEHPAARNHNGGQLQFGPDGYLYAGTGDGGGGGDPPENAQSLNSLLGKLLRIAPAASGGNPYTVPSDNPFAGATPGADEIWSYGLRNPWRFSFDRGTDALLIGDVGQNTWEEVDFDPGPNAGRSDNFGWDCREGMHDYDGPEAPGPDAPSPLCPGRVGTFTEPVFEYQQTDGNCSITGGYVVRDPSLGELLGRYVYADLCVGSMRSLCPGVPSATGDRSEGIELTTPTSFGEDSAGRVYTVERGGVVSRLTGTAETGECPRPAPPPPAAPPPDDDVDTTAPTLELDAKRRHDLGKSRKLKLRASVDEAAAVELRAKVRPDRRDSFQLRDRTVHLAAGDEERLKWKLSRREARRALRRLKRGKKLSVRVKGRATDAAGNASERASVKIRLAR
jgi:glucose/arabinose dehydrogenase